MGYLRLNHFIKLVLSSPQTQEFLGAKKLVNEEKGLEKEQVVKEKQGFDGEQVERLKKLFILFEKAYISFPEHKGRNFPNYNMILSWLSPYVGHSYSYRFKYEMRNEHYKKIWDKVSPVFQSYLRS